jgi:putative peptidoglycan lipid II flippase
VSKPVPTATSTAADPAQQAGAGFARGAALIAGLTVFSRILGLARTLVFSQTVGTGCTGTAYVTANQVPSLVYELVLGGALASVMVPVLARTAERSGADPAAKARVGLISSALLTWSVIILVPITICVAAAAGPIASLLDPANASARCAHAEVVAATSQMIAVFAPQIILYGLSVVLYGLLQAYRRFTGPALGPTLSSLVVIGSYIAFASLARGLPLGRLPLGAELVLSTGTTAGVAALVVAGMVPVRRLHLRFRPVLRFPPGVARWAAGLAIVGVIELIAGDLSSVVAIALANGHGTNGAVVLYNFGWQAFSSLHAVLAVSIATSAFPLLAARDGNVFDQTCARSTRAVLLVSWLGTAVLAAIAVPAAHVMTRQPDQVPELMLGFVMFAPGLVGAGVIANLSRVLFTLGRLRIAATALAGSWLLVIIADVVLAEIVPARLVVPALGLGNAIGQTLVAIPLVLAIRRIRGPAAVQGAGRAALAGLAAACAGITAGVAISLALPAGHNLLAGIIAVLAASGAVIAFAVVAYILDDGDMRPALARLRQITLARLMTLTRLMTR